MQTLRICPAHASPLSPPLPCPVAFAPTFDRRRRFARKRLPPRLAKVILHGVLEDSRLVGVPRRRRDD